MTASLGRWTKKLFLPSSILCHPSVLFMSRAYIGVGSNINPAENVKQAIQALAQQKQIQLVAISTVYLTEAISRPEQPAYYNCVVAIETEESPIELKYRILRGIEHRLGRERTGDKCAPRTIDLDLIIYNDLMINVENLILPDPEIAQRPFLAIPLHELAPELTLSSLGGLSIAEIVAKMSVEPQNMVPLSSYTETLRKEFMHE